MNTYVLEYRERERAKVGSKITHVILFLQYVYATDMKWALNECALSKWIIQILRNFGTRHEKTMSLF